MRTLENTYQKRWISLDASLKAILFGLGDTTIVYIIEIMGRDVIKENDF